MGKQRLLLNSSLVATFLLLLNACGNSVTPGKDGSGATLEGYACSDPKECASGLSCYMERCHKVCNTNKDCASNQHCNDAKVCAEGTYVVCGNGIKEPTEDCDDENNTPGDGCSASCAIETGWNCKENSDGKSICTPICGDKFQVVGKEECDDGNNNDLSKECLTTCKLNVCGDGHLLAGKEACDDGNKNDHDGCNAQCQVEETHNCTNTPGEKSVCTPKNDNPGDEPKCGNGVRESGEACDDGNSDNEDGCSAGCTVEDSYTCQGEIGEKSVCTPSVLPPSCDQTRWLDDCSNCRSGFYGDNCQDTCPDCGAHGSCSDGLGGTGLCECNGNWDGDLCNICKSGWEGADCNTVTSVIVNAPTINADKPFNNACNKDVVGWKDQAGNDTAVAFEHDMLESRAYSYECRSAPAGKIDDAKWAPSGRGSCTLVQDSNVKNGKYITQIRAKHINSGSLSSVASVSYYITSSLDGVKCCTSKISDDVWFEKAKTVLSTSAKFVSSNLTLPYVSIEGVEGERAAPVSLRKKFTMNNDNTLLLLTRHTASGYAQRNGGSKDTCSPGMYAWLGRMIEPTGEHYYHCNEVGEHRNNVPYTRKGGDSNYNITTNCEWEYNSSGKKYCQKYRYIFKGVQGSNTGNTYTIEKTAACVHETIFKGLFVKSHTNRELTACDAMVFNAYGDIACLKASGSSVTVDKTVLNKHNYTIHGGIGLWQKGQMSPGFRILDGNDNITQCTGCQSHKSLFSDKYWFNLM